MFLYRGNTFRKHIKQIGEVRSLIPSNVNIMALSATCTRPVHQVVSRRLSMHDPFLLAIPPCRDNIKYIVIRYTCLSEAFSKYVDDLLIHNINAERVIIYCTTYKHCCEIRDFFYLRLKQSRLYPSDTPIDKSQYQLVDMFTSLTDPLVKETIIKSFLAPTSTLCIVIATSAFGMGVNCKGIRKVINFGAPDDVEDYIQQTGRVGRDGLPSEAILLLSPDNMRHAGDKLKDYCKLTKTCRKDYLFSDYDNYSKNTIKQQDCCDICSFQSHDAQCTRD